VKGSCERGVDCFSWKSLKEDTSREKKIVGGEGNRWTMGTVRRDGFLYRTVMTPNNYP